MNKFKMTKTEQILLVVGVVVICMFFFMKKAYDPLTKEIRSLTGKNNRLVAEINTLKKEPLSTKSILKSINALTSENEQLEAEYQEIEGLFLTPKNMVEETVMKINETAANNALVVKELVPELSGKIKLPTAVQNEKKLLNRSVYHMKISGGFLDFQAFVNEILSLERLISMTSMDIRGENDRGQVEVDIVLLI